MGQFQQSLEPAPREGLVMASFSSSGQEHPFLSALLPEHQEVLVQGAEHKTLETGEILFREGQPASRFFLVHEGQVVLETHIPAHGEVTIAKIEAGQVLGWSWLVAPFVWLFQARAVAPTRVTVLNGAHLLVASEQNHFLGFELMKAVSRVVLEIVLAAHQRLLETGHRPLLPRAVKTEGPPPDLGEPLTVRMAEHPFFQGMAPAQLKVLADLVRPIQFEQNQVVFQANHPATGLYAVEQGQILLQVAQTTGSLPVQIVGTGDAFGWSSFCAPYRWYFDAQALERTSAWFLKAAEVRECCASDYHLGYEVTKRITRMMLQRVQATRSRMWEALR